MAMDRMQNNDRKDCETVSVYADTKLGFGCSTRATRGSIVDSDGSSMNVNDLHARGSRLCSLHAIDYLQFYHHANASYANKPVFEINNKPGCVHSPCCLSCLFLNDLQLEHSAPC